MKVSFGRRRATLRFSLTCAAAVALSVLLGQSPAAQGTVTSTWRSSDVAIDGSMTDWPSLVRVGNGPAVAVQNDDTFLYLAVASSDADVRLQLATGLIIWIDGAARRQQTFGLRLEGLAPRPLIGATPTTTREAIPDRVQNALDRFDLLGPARLQRRLIDEPASLGFLLASGVENDTIVYEVRVPLTKTDAMPHTPATRPGATVSLGLETPPDLQRPRERSRLDNPMGTTPWVQDPWGYGGYFTTPPPPPGGRPKPPPELKPMKLLWTTVALATPPAP